MWNTLAGYLLFALLYAVLGKQIPYPAVATIAHGVAVTQAFASQRWLVYHSKGHWLAEYGRFHLAHLGLFLVALGCLTGLVEWAGWHPLWAQAAVTAGAAFASYFVHTYFTFRKTRR